MSELICETCPFWDKAHGLKNKADVVVNAPCRWEPRFAGDDASENFLWTARFEWCRHHPDAPKVITRREAIDWRNDDAERMVITLWDEWQEVRPDE